MKMTKRILSILLACVMLACVMPMAVSAAGTQEDPIDATTKWFGYGADTYLLNPTIAEGTTDGIWYTLTAENDGVLFLEHSYKNVDYTVYVTVNGKVYEGGSVDGVPYNRPIHTYSLKTGDVATVQIVTKDAAAGTVYANMNVIESSASNTIKVKSVDYPIYVSAGETVYFQDDSLQAEYAAKTAILSGDSVEGVTFYNVVNNSTTGTITQTPNTDTDGDGVIEVKLGGSEASTGSPAVKPAWAVENTSNVDKCFTLNIVAGAHECNWDNATDTDCNTCGAIREVVQSCQHSYDNTCDADCNLCGEVRAAEHTYSSDLDVDCDVCGENRDVELPFEWTGASISQDVNGLACRFDLTVEGMATKGNEAVYDNATFCGYKLLNMGAVVCNNFDGVNLPKIEDANGANTLNIPAKYLYEVNEEEGTVAYAIRITEIPEANKDTTVTFVPYVVLEDAEGNQHTLYITDWVYIGSYNEVANG